MTSPGEVFDTAIRQAAVTLTPCGVASLGECSPKDKYIINRNLPIERRGERERRKEILARVMESISFIYCF